MDTTSVKVWQLGWNGMEKKAVTVQSFDKTKLKVDDWFYPQIGELCFNDKGEIDVVKKISLRARTELFKAANVFTFVNSKKTSTRPIRLEVKKGNVFIFKGSVFVHQEPLDGGYIDSIARNEKITEYE